MRKFLLPITLFLLSVNIFAAPVSSQQALKVASAYMANNSASFTSGGGTLDLVAMATSTISQSDPQIYFFNSANGFIIISGDDAASPVIAYSNEGILQQNNLPHGFIKWMDKVRQEINYIRQNKLEATAEIKKEWEDLYNGTSVHPITNAVNPLIATKWDQSPYYNALCPYDNTYSDRTVTGCVATAMAQIMKYHNYPAQGTGSHSYNHVRYGTLSANFGATTYNWGSMPNNVTSANSSVATLMYHCGVSVDMDYNVGSQGGSGAYSSALPYAYKNYFGYTSTVNYILRSSYSDANWKSMMQAELDASRPIQYSGQGTHGGHSFVMDGYDSNGKFHFNWGWGGSSDGYFTIDALNPGSLGTGGGAGGFNAYQTAIIGIKPPAGGGGSGTTDMRLYSSIVVNPNPIVYGSSFTVTVNVANFGTSSANNFSGDYTAALFNSSNQFVAYVETKTGFTLNYNSYYINPLVFTTSSISALTPGTYTIGIYYKATGATQWSAFANGNYQNFITVQVEGNSTNNLKLYAAITTTPAVIVRNQTFTVQFDIANYATSAFNGEVSVDIHKSDGTWIRELSTKSGLSLPSNTHFINGLTYTITGGISDAPGTYQLFVWDKPTGGSWQFLGNGTFSNPITIQVVEPGLSPDGYEVNNTQAQAASLNLVFSPNSGSIKTSGSNIHTGSDVDYYYIDLPPNFNYTITPRIHDSYSSGDGNTYTCDATFAYSTDGVNYSASIDDVMTGSFTKNNGGRIYFTVSPYFTGKTGTYALDVKGTRTAVSSGINVVNSSGLKCYPNPASDHLNIEIAGTKLLHYSITDVSGKSILEFDDASGKVLLSLDRFEQGIYFIKAVDGDKTYTSKFIINR